MNIRTFSNQVKEVGNSYKTPIPSRCPNPKCQCHTDQGGKVDWFRLRGQSISNRHGKVNLYMCLYCERSFSESTFWSSYYEKKNVDLNTVLKFADRQISLRKWASLVEVHPEVLKLRLCKIGCLLLNQVMKSELWVLGVKLMIRLMGKKKKGVGAYRLLRELIISLNEILQIWFQEKPKRCFLSSLDQESVLYILRVRFCRWKYYISDGFYYHTKYQIE